MSASGASAAAAGPAHRGPRLRRIITRISGYGEQEFVLQIVQPSLVGMIDGTVSTLAPIFAAAVSAARGPRCSSEWPPPSAPGSASGFSEALSDTGEQTGRGSGLIRGAITGAATTLGGVFHSLPFLIGDVNRALIVAGIVVAIELFAIACVRHRFLHMSLRSSLAVVTLGGALVLAIGVAIGSS